jgi:hypothetical protein
LVFTVLQAPAASALNISNIDLSTFNFDVVTYNTGSFSSGLGGDATASGTSNGIGWSVSPTNLWSGRTTTNGSFHFSSLPNPTDNLHPGIGFTITFNQSIHDILVALSNDNTSDSINFGIAPSDVVGNLHFVGTQAVLDSPSGGLALFTGLNTLTLTHTDNNGSNDGFDLAFHVVSAGPLSAVPEPSTLLILTAGLGAVSTLRRRKRKAG